MLLLLILLLLAVFSWPFFCSYYRSFQVTRRSLGPIETVGMAVVGYLSVFDCMLNISNHIV